MNTTIMTSIQFMYRIRFEVPALKILFELRQENPVPLQCVTKLMKDNFNGTFVVTLEGRTLEDNDNIINGKVYLIKRTPRPRRKRKLVL